MAYTVYVRDDGDNVIEGLTKEQILNIIAGGTVDDVVINKFRETNKSVVLDWWFGTTEEFNALTEKEENRIYVCTDDSTLPDLETYLESVERRITNLTSRINSNSNRINDLTDELDKKAGFDITKLPNAVVNLPIGSMIIARNTGGFAYGKYGINQILRPIIYAHTDRPIPSDQLDFANQYIYNDSNAVGGMPNITGKTIPGDWSIRGVIPIDGKDRYNCIFLLQKISD